jgi:uncharacterized protein YuzE
MARRPQITFEFDEESDVLYISLNTGEPSFCEEIDDILLVEKGFYSGLVTGFRILDVKERGIEGVELKLLIQAFRTEKKRILDQLGKRKQFVPGLERRVEKELEQLLSA